MIVTDAQSYNMVLGMSWLTKAKAKINTDAQKMIFVNYGRKFSVPLDIRRGVLPRIVEIPENTKEEESEIEEDQTAYINVVQEQANVVEEVSSTYRRLTREEKNLLIE